MISRLRSTAHTKHHHTRDRSHRGGARLFDGPIPFGSSGSWEGGGKLWLLPVIAIAGVAAAYLITVDKTFSRQWCDTLRALQIDVPKSCRHPVWVRTKSKTVIRPISLPEGSSKKPRQ